MNRLGRSARAYDRILKVRRASADPEDSDEIQSSPFIIARWDRTYWT